jgi:hypothetical protein
MMRCLVARCVVPSLVLAGGAWRAQAQTPSAAPPTTPFVTPGVHGAVPGEARSVSGRVVRGRAGGPRPLGGAWVVLHRVGTDKAAPLDSVRTDATGKYAFAYRTSGDPRAIYFVSSVYGGVAYFSAPLRVATVRGDDAELVVHDTSSAPIPIRIRARHLVVSASDSGKTRAIIEIFELSNDSSVTRVAAGDTGTTWTSTLLAGARNGQVGRTDFSEEAVRFAAGRVRLTAPFAPGLKQFSFSYDVPVGTEYRLEVTEPAGVVEVLIEDGLGRAEGGGIAPAGPATVDGRTFSRFLAQDVHAGTSIRITAPTQGAVSRSQLRVLAIVAAVGLLLLLGLARTMMRRGAGASRARGPEDAAALRTRLAALDASFANIDQPSAEQRADHYEARAQLSTQIANAVAREQGLS